MQVLHHFVGTVQRVVVGACDHARRVHAGDQVPAQVVHAIRAHVLVGRGRVVRGRVRVVDGVTLPAQVADDRHGAVGLVVESARDDIVLVDGGDHVPGVVVLGIRAHVLAVRPACRRPGLADLLPGQVLDDSRHAVGGVVIRARDQAVGVLDGDLVAAHVVIITRADVVQVVFVLVPAYVIVALRQDQVPGSVVLVVRHHRLFRVGRGNGGGIGQASQLIVGVLRGQVIQAVFVGVLALVVIDDHAGALAVGVVSIFGNQPVRVADGLQQALGRTLGIGIPGGMAPGGHAVHQRTGVVIGGRIAVRVDDPGRLVGAVVGDGRLVLQRIDDTGQVCAVRAPGQVRGIAGRIRDGLWTEVAVIGLPILPPSMSVSFSNTPVARS